MRCGQGTGHCARRGINGPGHSSSVRCGRDTARSGPSFRNASDQHSRESGTALGAMTMSIGQLRQHESVLHRRLGVLGKGSGEEDAFDGGCGHGWLLQSLDRPPAVGGNRDQSDPFEGPSRRSLTSISRGSCQTCRRPPVSPSAPPAPSYRPRSITRRFVRLTPHHSTPRTSYRPPGFRLSVSQIPRYGLLPFLNDSEVLRYGLLPFMNDSRGPMVRASPVYERSRGPRELPRPFYERSRAPGELSRPLHERSEASRNPRPPLGPAFPGFRGPTENTKS